MSEPRSRVMRRVTLTIAATVIAVMLASGTSAFARAGDRPFVQTYPVASALCAKAKAGTLPAKLVPSAAAVTAACDTLENAFAPLVSTVDAAEATLLSTLSAQKTLVASACVKPVTNQTACAGARATAKSTDTAARSTNRAAVVAYHGAIEGNRMTFWSAISALR
jgi:hypothetical protein